MRKKRKHCNARSTSCSASDVSKNKARSLLGGPARRAERRKLDVPRSRLVDDLRHYQSELEIQNRALRFSQSAAEAAYERFVTLFSNVPSALLVVDDQGQILQNNAQALALLRPTEADPPLTYILPLIAQADADRVQAGFISAREEGVCALVEVSMRSGLERSFIGDMHIARLDGAEPGSVEFICAVVDQSPLIAQRSALQANAQTLQQRNDQLLESRSRLAAIIDASLDAIISTDATQRITVFNPAAQALFGYTRAQMIGQPVTMLLPEAGAVLTHSNVQAPTQLGEMVARNHRGEPVAVEVSLALEPHPDGTSATWFVHDLTGRKKAEIQRAKLEEQLRESQKMQAIGTLAGGIAHDFNNIIGAILGNLALARQDVVDNPQVTTSLHEVEKAGRRARDLVRQILTFSRNEQPHRVALALQDVVQETVRLFQVSLPPHVSLTSSIDKNAPAVLADPTQIEQVLLNLLTNALHAIGTQAGRIDVSLACLQDGLPPATPVSEAAVVLRVRDTGCGMDEATRERIFEPFFTTKPVGQGTGLGLSVVHGIVLAHGAKITVESRPGQGTCFTLCFAPTTRPCIVGTATASVRESPKGQGQRVMVVDDDEAQLFLVKRMLSRQGYQVIALSDPKAAIAMLTQQSNTCDALLTDFNMPGFSGVDLLRAVRAIRPDLPTALASGYVTPEIERDALAAGARALIHKPNDTDELSRVVAALLAGNSP